MLSRRACLLAILFVGRSAVAKPDDARTVGAKEHYERGVAHFNLQEYPAAIEEFEAGYRLRPDPVFLYNLGQANRLSDRPERALYFYRAYLRTSEDPPNRKEVEGRIADLEKLIADKKTLAKPPDQTLSPSEATPKAAGATTTPSTQSDQRQPLYKRWWLWTAVGGVVVVGVAIGVAVGLTTNQSSGFNANLGTVGPKALVQW
jgi:hypothetical protein